MRIYEEPKQIIKRSVSAFGKLKNSKSYRITLTGNERWYAVETEKAGNKVKFRVISPEIPKRFGKGNQMARGFTIREVGFDNRKKHLEELERTVHDKNEEPVLDDDGNEVKEKVYDKVNAERRETFVYDKMPLSIGQRKAEIEPRQEGNRYIYEFEVDPRKETQFTFGEGSGAGELVDDLVSYWSLEDDTNASVVTDSHGSNDGVAMEYDEDTTTHSEQNTSELSTDGKVGKAFNFDGSSDWVEIPDDNSLDIVIGGTIGVWVYPQDGMIESSHIGIVDKWWDGTNRAFYIAISTDVNRFRMGLSQTGGTAEKQITIGPIIEYDKWYHIVLTWTTGETAYLYINGTPYDLGIKAHDTETNTDSINIGAHYNKNRFFAGKIDEVGIWSRALSAREIRMLYNNGVGLRYPLNSPFLRAQQLLMSRNF